MARNLTTIHLFHHSLARGGGMERYAGTVASEWRRQGHPVVFHAYHVDRGLAAEWQVEAAPVHIRTLPRKLQDFRFSRAVERVRPGLSGDRLEISLGRAPARDLVICGGTHRGFLRRTSRWVGPIDWLHIRLEHKAYHCARKVVSHSPLCTNELRTLYGVPQERIVTLYPPVDGQFHPPATVAERSEARRQLGLPEDRIVFLFPSTGHSRKGLEPIRRALSSLDSDLVLAVAGTAPGARVNGSIRYLGYLADMATAYHAADFTILGSYYEPFGLVGPESLLCGTRLVFERDIGALAAINPEYVSLFDVRNAESIRETVMNCLALARKQEHRIAKVDLALTYDPSPSRHVRELLRVVSDNAGVSDVHLPLLPGNV